MKKEMHVYFSFIQKYILLGTCSCADGYTGKHCELSCPSGFYGKQCKLECNCQFNELCDPVNGMTN